MSAPDCKYEQCRYNVNNRCAVVYQRNEVQIPKYCPYFIEKEDE